MSATNAPVIILIFGCLGILFLAVAFVCALIWHQRRWMQALEARSRAQASLLEASQVGRLILWSSRLDGSHLELGEGLEELLGRSALSLPTLETLLSQVAEGDRETLALKLAHAPSEGQEICRVRMLNSAGESLDTQWQFGRRPTGLKGVIRDISPEARLQNQLLLAQRMEVLATLVAGIAHEFGNILASVEGCTRALGRQETASPKEQRGIQLILDACQRGRGIIQQLLDMGRRSPDAMAQIDANHLCGQTRDLLTPLLGRRYQIHLELQPQLPRVQANPTRLHQALLNLCMNARDAMPDGGSLTLRTRLRPLAAPPGSAVCLEVEDCGEGIPSQIQERIFDPFFTTKPPGKGTGLGLAVTRSIVEAHQGELHCESQPGRGTCFSVCLPAFAAEEKTAPQTPAQGAECALGHYGLRSTTD